MSVNREAIYQALFQRLINKLRVDNGGPFVTVGRRVTPPPTLTATQQPAIFIWERAEDKSYKPQTGTVPIRGAGGSLTLICRLMVYCYRPQLTEKLGFESELSSTEINELLQAIDDALAPDFPNMTNLQQLGGLVYDCKIDGTTTIADPGSTNQQASVIVPLSIIVPQ